MSLRRDLSLITSVASLSFSIVIRSWTEQKATSDSEITVLQAYIQCSDIYFESAVLHCRQSPSFVFVTRRYITGRASPAARP